MRLAVRFAASGSRELEWDCEQCIAKGDDKRRNCDGTGQRIRTTWDNALERCPWAEITDGSWAVVDSWALWRRHGLLPFAGSLRDQPVWAYQMLLGCDEEFRTLEDEARKRAEDEARRAAERGRRQ